MVDSAKNEILFVCIENSSRSQMAEGFAKARGLASVKRWNLSHFLCEPLGHTSHE